MANQPIDPLTGSRYALKGRVVTMNSAFQVLERGVVYIDAGRITAVLPSSAPRPPGFHDSPLLDTRGTIFPGLIELHNHLSYNVLLLWAVPKQFTNRGQWSGVPDYRKLISGPMQVLGTTPGFVEAIVRYVECKCLLAGVTTSQGIALYSNNSIQRYYRGIIRNVEETDDPQLPDAATKISDVEAHDAQKFLERLQKSSCTLLHLSEGIDQKAHEHFEALHMLNGQWAISKQLSGIHCAGLRPEDFQIMKDLGASMIWSPLSNLLLYGQTADIRAAKESGILIGIGSDWSPSGSKNLLGELKVARLFSQEHGGIFTDCEIVSMATCNAAKILQWDKSLGSLETGKRADLVVIDGKTGDPYAQLLQSSETAFSLVVINGVPRFGRTRLMQPLGEITEYWSLRRSRRALNLKQATADPMVGSLTLRQARDRLKDGMHRLPELAKALESLPFGVLPGGLMAGQTQWYLLLDHEMLEGESQRPNLPFGAGGFETGEIMTAAAAVPLSQVLEPGELDPLTVVDDQQFFVRLTQETNLPSYIKTGLPNLYG